MKTSHPPDKVA